MADARFLLIRLGSMGDIVHALPAASALRDAFPSARIDWIVEPKWARVLEGNPDLSEVILLDRKNPNALLHAVRKLRAANYTCAIDFQGLYKSSLLAFASGAPRRVGFQSSYAREGLASLGYTERLNPRGPHKVDHNLTLVEFAGAQKSEPRFPLAVHPDDDARVSQELAAHQIGEFFVLNPGGGWRSKCWPAERYGELHQKLAALYGCRGVVSFGPGEEDIVRELVGAAGRATKGAVGRATKGAVGRATKGAVGRATGGAVGRATRGAVDIDPPVAIPLGLGPLMALLRRAKFVVSADTGPLHLASALGVPVVGLFGPTDPSRNGPYSTHTPGNIVVRNPRDCETTYRRGDSYSPAMVSITVEQVFDAVERLLELRS